MRPESMYLFTKENPEIKAYQYKNTGEPLPLFLSGCNIINSVEGLSFVNDKGNKLPLSPGVWIVKAGDLLETIEDSLFSAWDGYAQKFVQGTSKKCPKCCQPGYLVGERIKYIVDLSYAGFGPHLGNTAIIEEYVDGHACITHNGRTSYSNIAYCDPVENHDYISRKAITAMAPLKNFVCPICKKHLYIQKGHRVRFKEDCSFRWRKGDVACTVKLSKYSTDRVVVSYPYCGEAVEVEVSIGDIERVPPHKVDSPYEPPARIVQPFMGVFYRKTF